MNDSFDRKRRTVDLRQCLLYILDHIVPIIIVGVIAAAALCGFGYVRTQKNSSSQKTFEAITAQNRKAFYPDGTGTVLNTERKKVDGSCIVRAEIFIDYDFSSIEGNNNLDYSAMVSRFQQDAIVRMVSDAALGRISDEINKGSYSGVDSDSKLTAESLRWMINTYFTGANVMQFSVTDISKERGLAIAELLCDEFIREGKSYETFDALRVLEAPAVFADMTDKTEGFGIKSAVKYGILGGAAGVFLMIGIYLVIFLFTDRVRTSEDTDFLGITAFGRVPCKPEAREPEYRRLAYNLASAENCKKVLLVPTDPSVNASELADKVTEALKALKKDVRLTAAADIKSDPEALPKAAEADAVLLAASYGKTSLKDLEYARSEMSKTGKQLLGVVIDRCRHR